MGPANLGSNTMALLQWTDNLKVNVREFDEQHQKLVGMINDLHDAMAAGKGKEAMQPLLRNLVSYTMTHFRAEEQCMQKYQYPEYAQHKQQHEALTSKVADLRQRFEAGQLSITIETMNFLTDWLKKHIMGTDKRYSDFFARCGLGTAPVAVGR